MGKGKSLLWPGASQWRLYYHRMWGQLSTTFSNLLKQPNLELLVAVNHNQLRIIASETVDPITLPMRPLRVYILHGRWSTPWGVEVFHGEWEYFMGSGNTPWGVGVIHGKWQYPRGVGVFHGEWEYFMLSGSVLWGV